MKCGDVQTGVRLHRQPPHTRTQTDGRTSSRADSSIPKYANNDEYLVMFKYLQTSVFESAFPKTAVPPGIGAEELTPKPLVCARRCAAVTMIRMMVEKSNHLIQAASPAVQAKLRRIVVRTQRYKRSLLVVPWMCVHRGLHI